MDEKGLESEIKDRIPHDDGTGPQRQRDVKSLSYRRNSISEGEKGWEENRVVSVKRDPWRIQ